MQRANRRKKYITGKSSKIYAHITAEQWIRELYSKFHESNFGRTFEAQGAKKIVETAQGASGIFPVTATHATPIIGDSNGANGSSGTTTIHHVDATASCTTANGAAIPAPAFEIFPSSGIRLQWDAALRCSTGVGLNNLGDTCFLNSVLQVLTNTAPLVNYLLSDDHQGRTCACATGFCALCLMKNHVHRIFNCARSGQDTMSPTDVVSSLCYFMKEHTEGRQEDAHELLGNFIDSMKTAALHEYKNQELDLFTKETSVIGRIFGGCHKTEIVCNSCHSSSVTFDPFSDLSIEIKQSSSLESALTHFTNEETLSGDNAYACSKCKRSVSARKMFTIIQPPNVLTIQLKRFDHLGKIDRVITYPERLNLRPYMSEKQGPPINYRLYGIVVHVGRTTHSGHYFAFVKNPCDQWHLMNDSRVSAAPDADLLSQPAYLLFYIMNLSENMVTENLVNRPMPKGRGRGRGARIPELVDVMDIARPGTIINNGINGPQRGMNGAGRGILAPQQRSDPECSFESKVSTAESSLEPELPTAESSVIELDASIQSAPPGSVIKTFDSPLGCCEIDSPVNYGDEDDGHQRSIDGRLLEKQEYYWESRQNSFSGATYIDTHCHLDLLFNRDGGFNGNYTEYMEKNQQSWSVASEGCIADFCYPEKFMSNTSIWRGLLTDSKAYLAFGCHPHVASSYNDDVEKFLENILSEKRVIALGEMGLDYSRNNNQKHDLQKDVFQTQLKLAVRYNKPLQIHCRYAEKDCFEIMKEIVPHDYPIHRHCFTEDYACALHWTGYFTKLKIGLTTGVYSPLSHQMGILKEFPLDRIIIETDSPYFLPRFCRQSEYGGLKHNHPGLGYIVALKLAEMRQLDTAHVLRMIRYNTKELYGI